MGKTYRKGEKRGWTRDAGLRVPYEAAQPRSEQPARITPEWAVERMKGRIDYVVRILRDNGVVDDMEVEDVRSLLVARLVEAVPTYDPEYRNEDGKTAGAAYYFRRVLDNAGLHYMRQAWKIRRLRRAVALVSMDPDEARKLGFLSESSVGDGCRSVRDLVFALDVNTLRGMLNPLEAVVFDMRLDGLSYLDISRRLVTSRRQVFNVIVTLRAKALKCGFIPRNEEKLEDM